MLKGAINMLTLSAEELKKKYNSNPKEYVELLYYYNTGKKLDLSNPITYNEKLQWIKLYGIGDIERKCADKYTMREYVYEKGFESNLPKLYFVFDDVGEIDFDILPSECMLKISCGWNNNILWQKDKLKKITPYLRMQLRKWKKEGFGLYTAETQYFNQKARIICEEYLGNVCDYKFLCFGGAPLLVQVDIDRGGAHKRNFYDLDWNLQTIRYGYPIDDSGISCPDCFDEMKKIASLLSTGFRHVRIDMYDNGEKAIIGEMTFTPTAGYKDFCPEQINTILGEKICIW